MWLRSRLATRHFSSSPCTSLGLIGVTFTEDQSRLQIPVPGIGKTWFVLEKDQTLLQLVHKHIHLENPDVEVKFYGQDWEEITDLNQTLWEYLLDSKKDLFIQMNSTCYQFDGPKVDVEAEAKSLEELNWQNKFEVDELSYLHRNTLSLFLGSAEKFVDEKGGKLTKEDLDEVIHNSLHIFDENLFDRKIYVK